MKACVIALLVLALIVIGCGGKSNLPAPAAEQAGNQPPPKAIRDQGDMPVSVPDAFPKEGGVPLRVHLWDAGSYDPDGEIVKWEWNFGDAATGEEAWQDFTASKGDAWHLYDKPGDKVAHLRVTDNDGNMDVAFVRIEMRQGNNANPIAVSCADPTEGNAPLTVDFSAAGSYDPDGTIVKWEWDFGDGIFTDFTTTQGIAEYTYTFGSLFTAILRVTDDDGATASASEEILVDEPGAGEWIHTWGGSNKDYGFDVAVDHHRNVLVTGQTTSFGLYGPYENVFLLKYSSSGSLLWQKTWGGRNYAYARSVAVDISGNAYVTGTTNSFGVGNCDIFLLKYNSDGNLLWQKTWCSGAFGYSFGRAVSVDGSGNVYLAGDGVLLLKYDPDGDLLWQKVSDGLNGTGVNGATVDGNGNVYVTGWGYGLNSQDLLLLKYDTDGNLLWLKTWGVSSGGELGTGVGVDGSGNVYVDGKFGNSHEEVMLLKYDPDGNLLWQKTWGGSGREWTFGLTVDGSGNAYATGWTTSFGDSSADMFLLKYDTQGSLLAQKTWGIGSSYDAGLGITVDPSGRIYIAGIAANIYGSWGTPSGYETTPTGTETTPLGTSTSITGTETNPSGLETTPAGVEDEGGGSSDVLVMKIDPSNL